MFRKLVRNPRERATLTQFLERERAVPRVLLKHLRADVQEAHFPNRVSTSPQREHGAALIITANCLQVCIFLRYKLMRRIALRKPVRQDRS